MIFPPKTCIMLNEVREMLVRMLCLAPERIKMADFSDRLREAMEKKGIRQAELCRLTGIQKSAISQYMSGKFVPRQDRLEQIAAALGTTTGRLLGYDNTEPLSDEELRIVEAFRADPAFRDSVMMLINGRTVFRVAKSDDGREAPSRERFDGEKLERLANAPETDEDF